MEYIITGRSIDGRRYYEGHGSVIGWTGSPDHATRMTKEKAEDMLHQIKKRYEPGLADDSVYCLKVIDAPPKRYGMWRKDKRLFRDFPPLDACQMAYYEGEFDALEGRPARCRYPKGFRRTAYLNGHAFTLLSKVTPFQGA